MTNSYFIAKNENDIFSFLDLYITFFFQIFFELVAYQTILGCFYIMEEELA